MAVDELEVAKNEDIGLTHVEGPAVRRLKRWADLEQGNDEVPQGYHVADGKPNTEVLFFSTKVGHTGRRRTREKDERHMLTKFMVIRK